MTSPATEHDPEDLDTLKAIAEELGITTAQINRWAEPSRDIGFPKPAEILGRYKLYNRAEVIRWVALWRRVQKNFKNNYFADGDKDE